MPYAVARTVTRDEHAGCYQRLVAHSGRLSATLAGLLL